MLWLIEVQWSIYASGADMVTINLQAYTYEQLIKKFN